MNVRLPILLLCAVCLNACGTLSGPAAPTGTRSAATPGEDMARGAIGAAIGRSDGADDRVDTVLANARARVRAATEWVARGVDGWFGDRPYPERERVSSGSIGLNTLWRQDEAFKANVRFRARIDLPNLKEQTYLFLGQDNERDLVTDQPEPFSQQQQLLAESRRDDQTFFAGLGYRLREALDLRVGVRGGYNLYTQARYRKQWWLSERDSLEFRETVFWTVKDGFGSTTALNYEHAFSPVLALRWRTAGTFSEKTDGLAWSSSLGAFRSFGAQRLASLEALIHGESGSRIAVAEYGVRAGWRQALYRDWLLGELIVGHFWPRDEDDARRQRSWAIGLGLEMLF